MKGAECQRRKVRDARGAVGVPRESGQGAVLLPENFNFNFLVNGPFLVKKICVQARGIAQCPINLRNTPLRISSFLHDACLPSIANADQPDHASDALSHRLHYYVCSG